jgi:hypothetical protein
MLTTTMMYLSHQKYKVKLNNKKICMKFKNSININNSLIERKSNNNIFNTNKTKSSISIYPNSYS